MSLQGSCRCRNILLHWQCRDYSLVPRACQCAYCVRQHAAWVSKSGTALHAVIHDPRQHRVVEQGPAGAQFHECAHCNDVVLVTADIDGELYGAANARCVVNPRGFQNAVPGDTTALSVAAKRERWRLNWCSPLSIRIAPQETG